VACTAKGVATDIIEMDATTAIAILERIISNTSRKIKVKNFF